MTESLQLLLARRQRRLTQSELARLAGVSIPTIYRLERGHAAAPGVDTLRRIATALETTPEQLFPELLSTSQPKPTAAA